MRPRSCSSSRFSRVKLRKKQTKGRLEYMDETKAIVVKKTLLEGEVETTKLWGRESARSVTTLGVVEIQDRIVSDHANT